MDKLRLRYEQLGRAAWISHLDMIRLLQRAMNRAGIPVRYSEGFNPHALISILLPLGVGTESLCQLVDIRVREDVELAALPQRLSAVLPEGLRVTEVWEDGRKGTELRWLRALCRWDYDDAVTRERLDALRALLAREELIVTRRTKRGEGPFDIRPHVQQLTLRAEGKSVVAEGLFSAAEPVVKPELLAKAVAENAPALAPVFGVCRRVELLDAQEKVFR